MTQSQTAVHLVGGFLGSGKTTAIIQAVKTWMARGRKVGVITNDQGKYLVDTAFFRLSRVPTVEVTGGCFCCNYDDLDDRLGQLIAAARPDAIFAESVGSCADVVATVVKPLLAFSHSPVQPASFSVFADARLLRRRLLGLDMPFSDDILYIFDKQIEESGLLVINKIDLLAPAETEALAQLARQRYPGKTILCQSSLAEAGVQPWLANIQAAGLALPDAALEIDYDRYGKGEAQLAWLDETIRLELAPGQDQAAIRDLLAALRQALTARQAAIGHLKFIIDSPAGSAKISLPTLEEPGWERQIPPIPGGTVQLSVNARVEMPAEDLRRVFAAVLDASGLRYQIADASAFHPGKPQPTHRIH